MRNRNPKMVAIIWNESKTDFKFKCKVCGYEWRKYPASKTYTWQCHRGCKLKDLEK